ncbi:MAG: glycosyl transferase family 36, partial [FCB group bacterium]|nr:glycosyl transferase family 36 [FCB group bacterium]
QLNGGFSWITHSNINRLTRWQQDLIRDNWGKYIYLRDEESGDFWSPTFQPVRKELDEYECCHGIGYTRFHSLYKGIEADLRLFVPVDDDLEIWTLRIRNTGDEQRRIGVFTYLEWCLGAVPDNHREFHKTFMKTEFDEKNQVLLAWKNLWEIPADKGHWNVNWNRTAYLACSESLEGFDSSKEAFIGNYRDLLCPRALITGKLTGRQGKGNDAIGSLKTTVHLAPGEEKTIHFFLGAEENSRRIYSILGKYRQPENIELAFREIQHRWDTILNATTVDTPDEALNIMVNIWLKYQAISGRLWGRAAYYQQSGAYGFRDQLQDSQVFLLDQPELTKKQILLHAGHQFKNGRVLHWWHPITDQGLDGNMSDDLLWLPFVTIQYLKETADLSILREEVEFYDDPKPHSLLQHCFKAIDLVLERFSDRGLPLILAGDWNDGMSAVGINGKGESLWLAQFLSYILKEFARVAAEGDCGDKARYYQGKAEELQAAIIRHGWDGEWFIRATKDNGNVIGSHKCEFGKIYLNPQTWSVISACAPRELQEKAMDSVNRHLVKKNGPLLLSPAYREPDENIGYLSRYAPGTRENGGVYSHAATWAIWAFGILKQADNAYQVFRRVCPVNNGKDPDEYCAEPYVTPGNIDGPDSDYYGKGGWTWYTGSATWLQKVTLEWILGIRAGFEGLTIDPCIPNSWKEFKVKRRFRNATYYIKVLNPEGVNGGIKSIEMDGKTVDSNILPSPMDGKTHKVTVVLGCSNNG